MIIINEKNFKESSEANEKTKLILASNIKELENKFTQIQSEY